MHFYQCNRCGEVYILNSENDTLRCCDSSLEEIQLNVSEGAFEKHIPVFEINSSVMKVSVGEVIHPMEIEHFIEWILVEKKDGYEIKYLKPLEEPVINFLDAENVLAIYAFCNKHGLWKKNI